ncbi:glycosyltransferase [Leucobacter sp. W1478]|uniref:glycosyltransferase n=1 Tax=Leucobacter sp. W1478 TaxID=3439065 RepID=UPI003F2D301E
MSGYAVDVIVPVHSAERPIDRAVGSVLDSTTTSTRVTVVAHNIEPEIIRARLGKYALHPHLRLLTLQDGIRSPAGPMNLGLERATAPFTALLGSDDEFAPGAIDSWLSVQRETGADAVLARIRLANGSVDPYPPVRRGSRIRNLDGETDRLAYRSAPLGLISRERFPELRLTEGVGSGEDLAYSLTVWFTGHHLAYDLDGPAYVINDDARDRVTAIARPLAEDFAFLEDLERKPWFLAASVSQRRAIVLKLIRLHVFDSLRKRTASAAELADALPDLRVLFQRFERIAPGAVKLLSVADRRVLSVLLGSAEDAVRLGKLIEARQRFPMPATIIPRNPLLVLHRQAPFRTLLAGARIMRRRSSK